MHADEANQAVKAGVLLESGAYAYDPGDHHGPVLYYAVLPAAWARGQRTLAALDEATVRLVPAVAGAACVLFLGLLAMPLGRRASICAAAFLAVSPPALYYSRFFIQETLLVAFTLGAFLCARTWWRRGGLVWAIGAGAAAGLMQSTKESAPLYLAAALAALAFARPGRGASRRPMRDVALAAAAALVVITAFYSSFGTHPSGIADAARAYGAIAGRLSSGATGHEKPWTYYIGLFAWQLRGGLVFEQSLFSMLALAGIVTAVGAGNPLLRWAAGYAALLLVALSAMAYKTPWNILELVPALALLAAGALGTLARLPGGRVLAAALGIATLSLLGIQANQAALAYPSDERNPYAYVQSSPDILRLREIAGRAAAFLPSRPIRVISEEYWPIPWYLRDLGQVGYWSTPPADCDGSLVVVSAGLDREVESRLHGAYSRSYLGLRPGFVLVLLTPKP